MLLFTALVIAIFVAPSIQDRPPLENLTLVHAWNNLEYGFESPEDYEYAIQSRSYIPDGFKRPYDVDMAVDKNGKVSVYMSMPRIVNGIPYTLGRISKKQGKYGPLLEPYPNFKAHSERDNPNNCDRIISVFRMKIDNCGRLWAIDNGRNFSAAPGPTQVCPPKIVVYDLETDKLIYKYEIPKDQYNNQTVYNGIIVDIYGQQTKGRCERGMIYVSDARGFSLLVVKITSKGLKSWVIYNDSFKTDPAYINSTINGETFPFPDGLYTTTPDRKRNKLYSHALTSLTEYASDLSVINDEGLWRNNPSGNQDVFKAIGMRKTQCPVQAIDSCGDNVFFSQWQPSLSILSWNPDKSYEQSNFRTLVVNNETLAFVAGMKVVTNSKGEEALLLLSNNLQKLNTGSISLKEINYRVMICRLKALLSGKGPCGGL